jgi:broad specificity phosphatase PhoE
MKTTDGKLTWGPDPELTLLGIEQAHKIHRAWKREARLGAPIGKSEMRWFFSPFTRTAQTMLHTWGDLLIGTPEVWEVGF